MKTTRHDSVLLYALALILSMLSVKVDAQAPPAGFASVTVSNQWTEAVGLTFTQDGSKMFVWERGGKVWVVVNNQKQLLLDISDEVGAWWDHGLLGFALHPQFDQNGYFYLHYLVDRHHLINYGTGAYNPAVNDYYSATISRITRYTATPSGNGYYVDPSSRKILLGETKKTGGPSTDRSHVVGGIAFGTDNTLMVGIGDGAGATTDLGSFSTTYYMQALGDSILIPAWNIGVFRSQLMNCLNGKILRIDPETGSGVPSNPFYDPLRPDAPISKVWAVGVRQPFRIMHKPGTGSHNPDEGNPGIFYFGEVGYNTWEELNVIDRPGINFGWPIFEGLTPSVFAPINTPNTGAPNPLYLTGGCTQQYFNFQDLLKQATPSGTAAFNNPCNGSQGIPSSIPTFVHTRPLIDWRHGAGPSRTGTFSGQTATEANLGAGPVAGPQFGGSAAVGGVFYTGTDFPESYQNTYFFGDYGSGWIRNLTVDGSDRPVSVRNFVNSNATVVYMTTNPTGEGLYYINFGSEIRRIYYTANRPPVAVASSDKTFGPSPLQIQFTGDASADPEGQPLSYSWDFGDGSPPNTSPNPSHPFSAAPGVPTKYVVKLTVRDNQNLLDETTQVISVNNTPPRVTITSPLDSTLYPMSGETNYPLQAEVTDDEHSGAQLSYAWLTVLHHNQHEHPDPIDTSPSTTVQVAPLGCDGQTYYTRIILTVTDAAGAATTKEVRLYPDCTGVMLDPELTWPPPAPITVGTPLGVSQLNASASYNGTTVVGTFEYSPAVGTVLNVGNNQPLSVTFTPSNTTLFHEVSKTVAIDVLAGGNTLYRAININGPALLIDGNNWEAGASAPNLLFTNSTAFANQAVTLVPATDANRAAMIRSSVWGSGLSLSLGAIPAATYQIFLYVWEDNSPETFSLSLEGTVVQSNYNSGTTGTWTKLGPYQATINDGTINLNSSGGAANFSGLEVWRIGAPAANQPPVVANPIADRGTPAGSAFSYTFPTNTFADPDIGTVLSYAATLSPTGALPAWLNFTAATRTFSGTPAIGDIGALQIQLTASDGAGGSISDVFALTVNPPAPNQPPVVSNPIVDQSASAAALFSFAFPVNTFSDPDAGTVLSYAATLSPIGALPAWLSFNPSTRTFSGTPAAGDIGTLQIQVTASDGVVGGTVSDLFTLTISPPSATTLYRAINLNGPALVIDGINWEAGTGAPGLSYTNGTLYTNQTVSLIPATDANRASMIRSCIWGRGWTLTLGSIPAGTYQVFIYAWEDNTPEIFSISLEGATVQANYNSGPGGTWRRLGPYQAIINDGAINLAATGGAANFGGLEVWRVGAPVGNQPPVVANPIADRSTPAGSAFTFTFPTTTFSDPDIGTVLTYAATLFPSGALPSWLSLNATTRTLSGTPTTGDIGILQIQLTASDGAGGSISDVFALTVNPPAPNQPPVVSNPIADQNASAGGLFSFAFPANTFSDPDAGTVLSYTATLSPSGTLPAWLSFNTATRTFSGTPVAGDIGTLQIQVTASDGVVGGTISDVFTLTINPASATTLFRAININGPALLIDGNNWEAGASAPNLLFTNSTAFANQAVTLVPATDANRAAMIRSSVWGSGLSLSLGAIPAGTYQIFLYVWEDNSPETFSLSLEGTVVQSNYNSGTT
ncbi:MAG TPA: putative Ig domain-containing protein, partial [Chryseolinea sp.]|nr:putative Ig domain-containing protein [Chryseolinea sp.]